jgi:hypothetical protein
MDQKLYLTPNPRFRDDTSTPIEKDIADFLLTFEGLRRVNYQPAKIITFPFPNEQGWVVQACQMFFDGWGIFVYNPEEDRMYEFKDAFVPAKDKIRATLKYGLRMLFPGAEERVTLWNVSRDVEKLKGFDINGVPDDIWYHFNGTSAQLIDILKKKSHTLDRLFVR